MSDTTGSVGGVGGADNSNGTSAAADAAAAAAAQTNAAQRAADAMVDAATGPTGVNVDALGHAVASRSAAEPKTAAEVQAAISAQLRPVQVGELQAAIDRSVLSGQIATPVELATQPSLPEVEIAPSLYNAAGQPIDTCGNVVTTMSVNRPDPLAESYRQAVENLGRAVGGPVSGPAYTAAWASGMSQPQLDRTHEFTQHLDGLFERYSSAAESMHVPISDARP